MQPSTQGEEPPADLKDEYDVQEAFNEFVLTVGLVQVETQLTHSSNAPGSNPRT